MNTQRCGRHLGKPIGNFEHIAFELAEMATEVEIGSTFLHACVEEFIMGEDITKKVSMAKAWISEMCNRVAYKAVQIHGGYGYMQEYRIRQALPGCARDAHLRRYDGDHEPRHRPTARVQADILAGGMRK